MQLPNKQNSSNQVRKRKGRQRTQKKREKMPKVVDGIEVIKRYEKLSSINFYIGT